MLDALIGDPRVPYHPVALLGKLIGKWEKALYRGTGSARQQRLAGACLVIFNTIPVLLVTWYALLLFKELAPVLYLAVSVLLLWSTFAVRSLSRAGREILACLEAGDLPQARELLRLIVGRDTENLDPAGITRAAVETVAENISDGIIAPLFYFLIGGAPLACTYRVINTLDSMVGYKNDRYLDFGWFAARLDDLANYIPARLTALLLLGSAFLFGYDWRQAYRMILRDRHQHPSPNSGYPEAAVAGALQIQLGGTNYYQGAPSFHRHLGDPVKLLDKVQIKATLDLMYGSLAIFLFIYAAGWFLWYGFCLWRGYP